MGILVREDMGILVKIWEYQGRFADTSKDMGISVKIWEYQERCLIYVGRYWKLRKDMEAEGKYGKKWKDIERYQKIWKTWKDIGQDGNI